MYAYGTVLYHSLNSTPGNVILETLNGICERGIFIDGIEIKKEMIDLKDVVFYQAVMDVRYETDAYY